MNRIAVARELISVAKLLGAGYGYRQGRKSWEIETSYAKEFDDLPPNVRQVVAELIEAESPGSDSSYWELVAEVTCTGYFEVKREPPYTSHEDNRELTSVTVTNHSPKGKGEKVVVKGSMLQKLSSMLSREVEALDISEELDEAKQAEKENWESAWERRWEEERGQ